MLGVSFSHVGLLEPAVVFHNDRCIAGSPVLGKMTFATSDINFCILVFSLHKLARIESN